MLCLLLILNFESITSCDHQIGRSLFWWFVLHHLCSDSFVLVAQNLPQLVLKPYSNTYHLHLWLQKISSLFFLERASSPLRFPTAPLKPILVSPLCTLSNQVCGSWLVCFLLLFGWFLRATANFTGKSSTAHTQNSKYSFNAFKY